MKKSIKLAGFFLMALTYTILMVHVLIPHHHAEEHPAGNHNHSVHSSGHTHSAEHQGDHQHDVSISESDANSLAHALSHIIHNDENGDNYFPSSKIDIVKNDQSVAAAIIFNDFQWNHPEINSIASCFPDDPPLSDFLFRFTSFRAPPFS